MGKKAFHIGICMAGAVSAGAYTAGVMDYLLEALREWQKRKDENTADTPMHDVIISVIGGASAGGMTGIITSAAINNLIEPVIFPETMDDILKEQPQNRFYNSWVDLVAMDMFPLMLDTTDIDSTGQVDSLLNSDFIDKIADKVLQVDLQKLTPLPNFFSPKLKVFTTLTNLAGFPYDVSFKGSMKNDTYYMTIHNDYACFQLERDSTKADQGWLPLNFTNNTGVATAKAAAMATGAFPVGLKSRIVERDGAIVQENIWLKDYLKNTKLPEVYTTQNVDGGLINNEPFEKVRDVLGSVTGQKDCDEANDYNKIKGTIVMIEPFPSGKPGAFTINKTLFSTISNTLSAIIGQLRSKPSNVTDAMNKDKAGQYLITPSRKRPNLKGIVEEVQGDKAIACGAFDGFSGFLNKEFRVHDYYLGRYNCEIFLRKYFTIPATAKDNNEIFSEGYAGINASQFTVVENGKKYYQIIPIFTKQSSDFPIPVFSSGTNWPVIQQKDIDRFSQLLSKRVQAILLNSTKLNFWSWITIWIGSKLLLNKLLGNGVLKVIKDALSEHQLLKQD